MQFVFVRRFNQDFADCRCLHAMGLLARRELVGHLRTSTRLVVRGFDRALRPLMSLFFCVRALCAWE